MLVWVKDNEKSKSAKFFAIGKIRFDKSGEIQYIKEVKRFFQPYKFQFYNMFCQSFVEIEGVR